MPRPSQPPYEAGALLQPRQLQRWLDVNKVSKLTRIQTYWNFPAFSVDCEWLGYSNLVASFNMTATNNFSLPLDYEVPANPGFCPCIMWVDDEYNVYRYRLWDDVGEIMYFDAPVYNGQLIKKNFRLEIWNVEPTQVLTFNLNGAGTDEISQPYTYNTSTLYDGQTDPNYSIEFDDPVWVVKDNLSLEMYDNVLDFPFGQWRVLNGDAPAPYASYSQTLTLAADLVFYTSVAGAYDYMWQNDTALATAAAINIAFTVSLNDNDAFTLPIEWPAASVPVLN